MHGHREGRSDHEQIIARLKVVNFCYTDWIHILLDLLRADSVTLSTQVVGRPCSGSTEIRQRKFLEGSGRKTC